MNKEPVVDSWLNALSDTRQRTKAALKGVNPWDAIVDLLRQKHNLLIGERFAEMAYYTLGKAAPEQPGAMIVKGRNLISGLPDSVEITSLEVQAANNSQKTLPYVNWSPEGSARTIGILLYSIAAYEVNWLFIDILQQPIPEDSIEIESLFQRNLEELATFIRSDTLAEHWFRLNIVRQHLMQTYSQMSLEDFQRSRRGSDSCCSAEWVIHELCQFEAERRNEISGLLTAARKALKSETLL